MKAIQVSGFSVIALLVVFVSMDVHRIDKNQNISDLFNYRRTTGL